MFNGKMKAITFSYDDAVTQDKRLVKLLDTYNLKGTFNVNSELLGNADALVIEGQNISHVKMLPEEVRKLYKNHEVAVHTLTHLNLTEQKEEEIIRQVEEDRKNLSALMGYEVCGMAYPCGGVNNDDRVADIIKNHSGVAYARTITSTHNFDLQDNLYRFNPTVYHIEDPSMDLLFTLADRFFKEEAKTPKIFYIWGHSYEFDIHDTWDRFEEFCAYIAGREDVFYGTNTEVLLANKGLK